LLAIAASVITNWFQWKTERKKLQILLSQKISEIERQLSADYSRRFNEKKWAVYVEFVRMLKGLFEFELKELDGDDPEFHRFQKESERDLLVVASQLLLIGSDEVIKAFADWRTLHYVNGFKDRVALNAYIKLVNEMKFDLGHQNSQVNMYDMLESFVPKYNMRF
jgi:hypothetical protein